MANIDLSQYGITGVTEIVHNPSCEMIFEEETKPGLEGFEKGQVSELGAVNVMTGIYTGRSPKDKFIVMDENSEGLRYGGLLMSIRMITILQARRHGILSRRLLWKSSPAKKTVCSRLVLGSE